MIKRAPLFVDTHLKQFFEDELLNSALEYHALDLEVFDLEMKRVLTWKPFTQEILIEGVPVPAGLLRVQTYQYSIVPHLNSDCPYELLSGIQHTIDMASNTYVNTFLAPIEMTEIANKYVDFLPVQFACSPPNKIGQERSYLLYSKNTNAIEQVDDCDLESFFGQKNAVHCRLSIEAKQKLSQFTKMNQTVKLRLREEDMNNGAISLKASHLFSCSQMMATEISTNNMTPTEFITSDKVKALLRALETNRQNKWATLANEGHPEIKNEALMCLNISNLKLLAELNPSQITSQEKRFEPHSPS
ncbi:hypothetical protein AB4254_08795 [Vibrio breoganii]